jgi:hypothetical protein
MKIASSASLGGPHSGRAADQCQERRRYGQQVLDCNVHGRASGLPDGVMAEIYPIKIMVEPKLKLYGYNLNNNNSSLPKETTNHNTTKQSPDTARTERNITHCCWDWH